VKSWSRSNGQRLEQILVGRQHAGRAETAGCGVAVQGAAWRAQAAAVRCRSYRRHPGTFLDIDLLFRGPARQPISQHARPTTSVLRFPALTGAISLTGRPGQVCRHSPYRGRREGTQAQQSDAALIALIGENPLRNALRDAMPSLGNLAFQPPAPGANLPPIGPQPRRGWDSGACSSGAAAGAAAGSPVPHRAGHARSDSAGRRCGSVTRHSLSITRIDLTPCCFEPRVEGIGQIFGRGISGGEPLGRPRRGSGRRGLVHSGAAVRFAKHLLLTAWRADCPSRSMRSGKESGGKTGAADLGQVSTGSAAAGTVGRGGRHQVLSARGQIRKTTCRPSGTRPDAELGDPRCAGRLANLAARRSGFEAGPFGGG